MTAAGWTSLLILMWLGRGTLYCHTYRSFWHGCSLCWTVRGFVIFCTLIILTQ